MESRETNEDRLALQAFLMDINELENIEQKTSKFNAFETLGIVNTEIRHSNVLGWLMSPKESHGMGRHSSKSSSRRLRGATERT